MDSELCVSANTRIIAATSTDLEQDVQKGDFRKDLYYLLDVFPIHVPPLRQRLEDLPLLVNHLLDMLAGEMGLPNVPVVNPEVMEILAGYHWPGNVRELRNILERALILCDNQSIFPKDISVVSPFHV